MILLKMILLKYEILTFFCLPKIPCSEVNERTITIFNFYTIFRYISDVITSLATQRSEAIQSVN